MSGFPEDEREREGERLATSQPDPAEPAGEDDPAAEAEMEQATDRPEAADSVEERER